MRLDYDGKGNQQKHQVGGDVEGRGKDHVVVVGGALCFSLVNGLPEVGTWLSGLLTVLHGYPPVLVDRPAPIR